MEERKMKRGILLFGMVLLIGAFTLSSIAYADKGKAYSIRASYFAPSDVKDGFSFGGSIGTWVDEAVQIGIGSDFFFRNYRKSSYVADNDYADGTQATTYKTEVEYNTYIIPLMLELTLNFPALWKGSIFGHGGLGYELLINKERNYTQEVSETRLYGGFAWQVGAGVSFKLGSDSALFVEGYYNGAKVKRNLKEADKFLPVFEEVNLSGLGARVGLMLGPL